jgi:hypothetical protein
MDPLFNLREIAKHLLLLEDHLAHANKQCGDCIRKHLLTVEALADEGVALDVTGLHKGLCGDLGEMARKWAEALSDGQNIRQEIRIMRKQLTPLVFDPRGKEAAQRVASAYLRRKQAGRVPDVLHVPSRRVRKHLRELIEAMEDDIRESGHALQWADLEPESRDLNVETTRGINEAFRYLSHEWENFR